MNHLNSTTVQKFRITISQKTLINCGKYSELFKWRDDDFSDDELVKYLLNRGLYCILNITFNHNLYY